MATTRSPTDNTIMHGVMEKPATSSSFSERVKNTLGNFFPLTGTGYEAETQEEKEDDDEQDDIGSEISLNSLTQESNAYSNRETSSTDRFGVVRTLSKSANETNQSREFVTGTNWEVQLGSAIGKCNQNRRDDGEAHSGNHGQAGWCARKHEWIQE